MSKLEQTRGEDDGSVLGGLGFSVVAIKLEFLTCATLGSLLVTFLLTTPTSIACLVDVGRIGQDE